ncbi:MGMT family protein [Candidatus Roizmanbacteria bacterium]|nr:MGMT family protein [Candidatus Roizmanbacteria bacterium]
MKSKINPSKVYSLLKQIPRGRVTTYKGLAQALHTKAYRAIGQILKKNPDAPAVPCHRVIRSDGTIGGYMGGESSVSCTKKKKILMGEGIEFDENKVKNFKKVFFQSGSEPAPGIHSMPLIGLRLCQEKWEEHI